MSWQSIGRAAGADESWPALKHYRQAFKLDSDVDKAWYRRLTSSKSPPRRPDEPLPSTSANPSTSPPSASAETFKFQRTLQVHPDYESGKEHRSVQAVEAGIGKLATARRTPDDQSTHPSSTSFLRTSLARSIAANPYIAPDAPAPPPPAAPVSPADALASVAFLQADPEGPMPFGTLPHEVLILIMKQLVFSSVIPPRKPDDPSLLPGAAIARGKVKRRPPKEEKLLLELELGLEEPEVGWRSDVEALERFAATSRAARILTLDDGLWRCVFGLGIPHTYSDSLCFSGNSVCEPMFRLTRSPNTKTRCRLLVSSTVATIAGAILSSACSLVLYNASS